jgi:hypothetical protein
VRGRGLIVREHISISFSAISFVQAASSAIIFFEMEKCAKAVTYPDCALKCARRPTALSYNGTNLPPTEVTLFAGCTETNATAFFSGIAARVQEMFPLHANIVVVGPDADVPQPHKKVNIRAGRYFDTSIGAYRHYLGVTPNEHCHQRNDSPSGMSYVYDGQNRRAIYDAAQGWMLSNISYLNFVFPKTP